MITVEGTTDDRARPLWSIFAVLHWSGIDSTIFGSSLGDTLIVCSSGFCLCPWLARTRCKPLFIFNEYDIRIARFRPLSLVMNDTRQLNQIFLNGMGTRMDTLTD